MSRRRWLAVLAALGALVALAALTRPSPTNFSQYPGFEAYRAANVAGDALPSAPERALLWRHRPRFWIGADAEGPIDFYRDYVAHGTLTDGGGRPVAGPVTPALLNAHRDDPRATFVHVPARGPVRPVVYGRIARSDGALGRLTFLTYHAVFRTSGLPMGLASWAARVLDLVADVEDWHQLDHYTAATIVLDAAERPVALLLQQHNYQRAHLIGETVALEPDGRIALDVALRSNELYARRPGRSVRRAVRFADPAGLRYLMGFADAPMLSADDVTDAVREVDYALDFLAPSDAFYRFQGFLGARRRLPGRSGPPGADYNTRPALKPLDVQLAAAFWREGAREDLARLEAAGGDRRAFADLQMPILRARLSARP